MKKGWLRLIELGLVFLFGVALLFVAWDKIRQVDSKKSLVKPPLQPDESKIIHPFRYYVINPKELIADSAGMVMLESMDYEDSIVQVSVDSVRRLQFIDDWADKAFPTAVFAFKNLRCLDIGMRGFKTIPPGISQLEHLEAIDFQHGALERLPDDFCQLRNLQRATFLFSNLKELPECIGDLEKLEHLHLAFTPITRFPESMKNLRKLKEVLIAQSRDKPHISESEYQKLKAWLPDCTIRYKIENEE